MKNSKVELLNTRLNTLWIVILVVVLTPTSTFAQNPSASVGGSCSNIGSLSGSVTKPLICKRVSGKKKWALAPGGRCIIAGALAGTMKEPWVCQKVSGKLKWVASVNSNSPTSSTSISQTSTTVKTTKPPSGGGSSSSPSPTTNTTTTTTTTTIPVSCPTSGNVTSEITSASDGAWRRIISSGGSATNYYTRNVQGFIRNQSGVSVSVVLFSLSGNVWYGGTLEKSQTVSIGTNISIAAGGVYGWSKSYEALGHPDYQYVVPGEISRNETFQSFTFVSTDARCP